MRTVGPGFELGVELGPQHEGMIRQLGDLHQAVIRGKAAEDHPGTAQDVPVRVVELEAVAVTLVNQVHAVGPVGFRPGDEFTRVRAQAHRSPHFLDGPLVRHQVDDGVFRVGIELGAVGFVTVQHEAGELDAHHLHAQAQAQVRDPVFPGEAGCQDLPLHPPVAEPARHDNAVHVLQHLGIPVALQVLRIDPHDLHLPFHRDGGVDNGFPHAHVGIFQGNVLADDGDPDLGFGLLVSLHPPLPIGKVPIRGADVQSLVDEPSDAVFLQR